MPPWFPALALASRLIVETGSPDALCPDVAGTEQAILARLGELEVNGAANWRVRYTIGHAPDDASGDFIRLEIRDPKGERRLRRDLPMAGESCSTIKQVIALIVDRFFRAMVGHPEPEAPARPLAEEPAADTPAAPAEKRALAQPEGALVLAAQAGVVGPPVLPTVGLLFIAQRSPFSLSSALTWVVLPVHEELERGGQAEVRTGLFRLVPSWDLALSDARLALGPTLSVAGEWGSTSGLPESDVGYRTVAAIGGAAAVRLAPGRGSLLELSAVLEAPFRPFGGNFTVEGHEVLEPPDARWFLSLAFGPAWFQ